ncbi:hypothetical protein [Clostridium hydrogenum]|uniref:hypothetical protein n=1 Tax=Clostridium hydrogenum TaxID=2855764 RepID=UPI001F3A82E0|nr:hypothetical protein [Clostridium hydrogenum]
MGLSIVNIIILLVIVIAVMLFYNFVIKLYVLPKFKINKWVALAFGIIMFFATNVVGVAVKFKNGQFSIKQIPYFICMALFILAFFTFFDLMGWSSGAKYEKRNAKKDVVIRPKAKPNRVKNRDKDKK